MSLGILDDTKERVRQATDIVDLIGGQRELRRQGRIFVTHCPWHNDNRPSLQVNPERQSWKCWVCGNKGGDVFNWVMENEGVGFREALEMLAERAGIPLQNDVRSAPAESGTAGDKRTLYRAMAWVEQQLHRCLLEAPEAEPGRRYLASRNMTDESIRKYRVGFWPNEWNWILDRSRGTGFTPQVLEAIDLIGKSDKSGKWYDRFKGRVMFPIRDAQDRPIALGGRVLPEFADDRSGKYINSRETRLFSKSEQVYGLDIARASVSKTKNVIVVEGYTDVIMVNQFGIENVVAVLGTALTAQHIRLLRRFAESITLVLDGDEAGQRRTNEILKLFIAAQMDLRILTLPEGLDPCDFVSQRGADAFRGLLDQAIDALEHKVQIATRGIDLANETHRANRALEEILGTLAEAPRAIGAIQDTSRLREQQILARLAREFRLPEAELRTRLGQLRGGNKNAARREPEPAVAASPQGVEALSPEERELFEIMLLHPELAPQALESIGSVELSTDVGRTLYEHYFELEVAGESLDFASVIIALEESHLKNILVSLDELARAKAEHAQEDGPQRLSGLIRVFRHRETEQERREHIAALEERRLDEQEGLALLQQLIEQERDRQGIPAPTDG